MANRTCSEPGCERAHNSRGFCKMHGKRAMREGVISPLAPPPPRGETLRAKFMRIGWDEAPGGCWEWRGSRFRQGYGAIATPLSRKTARAHRVAYELEFGPLPEGAVVMHRCDNPPCVNPEHLSIGTAGQNMIDMTLKERSAYKLTIAQVRELRAAGTSGETYASIAKRFGVSESTAWSIINRKQRIYVN